VSARSWDISPPSSLLICGSIQFNVVSKGLNTERMSFYLNEAACEVRDLLLPTLEAPKAML
jgi:carnitine O-acetyltransferase